MALHQDEIFFGLVSGAMTIRALACGIMDAMVRRTARVGSADDHDDRTEHVLKLHRDVLVWALGDYVYGDHPEGR